MDKGAIRVSHWIGDDSKQLGLASDRLDAKHILHVVKRKLSRRDASIGIKDAIGEWSSITRAKNTSERSIIAHCDSNRRDFRILHQFNNTRRICKRVGLYRNLYNVRIKLA